MLNKKFQKISRYIVLTLLVASLFVTSAVPVHADGSIDNGWYPQHRMLGISDSPIAGAEGDWYLMPNLPLMQSSGVTVYDTSLSFEQFYEMLIVNEIDVDKFSPDYANGGKGGFAYSLRNIRFINNLDNPVRNYLVKPTSQYIQKFYEICSNYVDSPIPEKLALWGIAIAWYAILNDGESVANTDLVEWIDEIQSLGIYGLIQLGKANAQYDASAFDLINDSFAYIYSTCASTYANGRNWYWSFTPTSSPDDTTNNDLKFGYWSGWYQQVGTLVEGVRYYLYTSSGNNLEKAGTSGGATTPKDYYTDVPDETTDIVTDAEVYAVYGGETTNFSYIDYHDNTFYDIAGDQFINNGSLWYDASSHTYTCVTNNYYITVNNYYTYNYVNYYMPGSDVPFSTYAVYYQLPDGRNSATLTADDIYGMNLDFDVIPYDIASEDTRMMALYHLDGTFDNDAITYSYQGGSVDQWNFDFSGIRYGTSTPLFASSSLSPHEYMPVSSFSNTSGFKKDSGLSIPAGTYTFSGEFSSSGSVDKMGIVFWASNKAFRYSISYNIPFSITVTFDRPIVEIDYYSDQDYQVRFAFSASDLSLVGSSVSSLTYNYVNNPTATSLTGSSPVWSAPYSGYYRFSYKSSATSANIGYNRFYANALWSMDGSPFMGAILDSMPRGSYSSDYGNYIAGDFTANLNSNLQVHTFSVYLDAGDTLEFSASFSPGSTLNFTIQDVYIYGYGEENSNATVGDYSTFEFTNGASTQFVTTGDENFAGSLYLDGLGHDFKISLPENPNAAYGDWTVTFRYYQEQSTFDTYDSYIAFGSNSGAYNTAFASLIFNGQYFKVLCFDGYNSSGVNYGSGSNVTIPYGTWNTITICRSGCQLLFYLNGLQVMNVSQGTLGLTPDGYIYFHFAADSNVHYIDEIMVASYAMYTANHTPRLIPWDSNSVYVLPYAVNQNSIAVKTPYAISGYRIGGVRPTFPDTGMVYAYVDDNYIVSIQVYNGSLWLDCGGSVYFNGHWYNIENFRFGTVSEQYDADPAQSQTGSQEGSTSLFDLLNSMNNKLGDIVEAIGNIVDNVVNNTQNTISIVIHNSIDFISGLADFTISGIQRLVSGFNMVIAAISTALVAGWVNVTAPLTSLVTTVWACLPLGLREFVFGGFAVVMCGAVVGFLNKG